MSKNVAEQLSAILEQYARDVSSEVSAIATEVSDSVAKDLKATSPTGDSRKKKYKNGWTVNIEKVPGGGVNTVVYNKNKPQLTHLLEHGHLISNQHGSTGKRAPAIKHIEPAEQRGITKFLAELEIKL